MPTYGPDFAAHLAASTPVCRHLRTKALHVYGRETPDAFASSASSHYHCLLTQFVTGPDGALCVPETCQPARGCFCAR